MRFKKMLLYLLFLLFAISLGINILFYYKYFGNKPSLKIVSTKPVLPAELKPGEKLTIQIRYDLGRFDSAHIWARPYTQGRPTAGYHAHPSPLYRKSNAKSGNIEGWFYFKEPVHVDEIRVSMKNETGESKVISQKADVKWVEDAKSASAIKQNDETEDVPANVDFHKRIHAVVWEGQRYEMTYEGTQQISENVLGSVAPRPTGLAFHPDGRIAFSSGHGSTPKMVLAYWSPSEIGESVVNLQYANRSEREAEGKTEEQGFFWFFDGPLAFDAEGACYFSLGSCGPNGLYKVVSNSPVQIEKLYGDLYPTRSLQVPLFDTGHLYSTSSNGIFCYPIVANERKPDHVWFKIIGEKIQLSHCLIVNSHQVIATVVFRIPKGSSDKEYYLKTLIFDRDNKSFRVFPFDQAGPMAISCDGQKMIHFDHLTLTINEFSLASP